MPKSSHKRLPCGDQTGCEFKEWPDALAAMQSNQRGTHKNTKGGQVMEVFFAFCTKIKHSDQKHLAGGESLF